MTDPEDILRRQVQAQNAKLLVESTPHSATRLIACRFVRPEEELAEGEFFIPWTDTVKQQALGNIKRTLKWLATEAKMHGLPQDDINNAIDDEIDFLLRNLGIGPKDSGEEGSTPQH